ncbi:hypothetical protein [Corynebacterium doosanense]|uniref:DUF3168 domain-containing protein n=1 Tax=Corynebacterium doosanense CAU 212 = DSM 45436 TaxID=558173 RepID=A0A097IDG8_9CORY|nr:hypothetical protein [Corynebacterium doosanense]AIT60165.1 hypothetical protein CDOO_01960 [Corynebacterium doosanense CAU 212 = DSM 45436]
MSDVDVLKTIIERVSQMVPDMWVADVLPPADRLEKELPCVVIDLLPGAEEATSWGGQGFPVRLDRVGLDIEVVARSRAAATPVAAKVRQALHQLPHLAGTGVTQVDCPAFTTREDINLHVRVLGVVADVTLHA